MYRNLINLGLTTYNKLLASAILSIFYAADKACIYDLAVFSSVVKFFRISEVVAFFRRCISLELFN